MTTFHAWLKLLRIHTASLTFPAVLLGAIIGGETDLFRLLNFVLWAILFHGVGFAANNVFDIEYDRTDPHKSHFPLVTGEISLENAKSFVFFGSCVGSVWGLLLTNLSPLSILFLVLSITWGYVYNMTCKRIVSGVLFIMASTPCLCLFSYFSVAQQVKPLIMLLCVYLVSYMAYDIGYLGYFKDLPSDKVNLLKIIGSRFEHNVYKPSRLAKLMVLLRLSTLGFGYVIWFYLGAEGYSHAAMVSTILVEIAFLIQVHTQVDFSRGPLNVTRLCGITEVLAYLVLIFALGNYLGLGKTIFLVVAPILYYIILNWLTWRTVIAPRV